MSHTHRPPRITVATPDELVNRPSSEQPPSTSTGFQLLPSRPHSASRNRFRLNNIAMAILSPTFDRLESGVGTPGVGSSYGRGRRRWFTWRKILIGATLLIATVWLFGPRTSLSLKSANDKISDSMKFLDDWRHPSMPTTQLGAPPSHLHDDDSDLGAPAKNPNPRPHHKPLPPSSPHPKTFEDDKKPSISTYCPQEGAAAVKWGLMIDAGSTGSRIHVYKFNTCASKSSPQYEYEVFKSVKPGLSFFKPADGYTPAAAAESLDPLLKEALRVVPVEQQKCTPVSVRATAGLRLLGPKESTDILSAVRERLESKFPFAVVKGKGGIEIMDGSDEGVYAWVTANYLLGTISSQEAGKSGPQSEAGTYAVLDLGGASTQIVFKPTFASDTMEPGEHKYDLAFGKRKYELYQHSYLGYGLMKARQSVHELVTFMHDMRAPSRPPLPTDEQGFERIGNPCIAKGMARVVTLTDDTTDSKRNVTMEGSDLGSFDSCLRVVSLVMAKDSLCEVKPCSFSGVYQPSLLNTFSTGNVLLLSYFYDRVAQLLDASDPALNLSSESPKKGSSSAPVTVKTISELARTICEGSSSFRAMWDESKQSGEPGTSLLEDIEGRPEYCLDLTFMYSLLRLGYEFEDNREVYFGKKIDGTELGWALGAGIEMVGGADVECRV